MADENDKQSLSIGVPREVAAGERRVALTPSVVTALKKIGVTVILESGAGDEAGFPDAAYTEKGATIGTRDDALAADIVAMVQVIAGDPAHADLEKLRAGQVVVGMATPFAAPRISDAVAKRGAALFALELVPRTTRAQSMDVLSSQANVAGYKAVLLAAENLHKMFPLLTTAAGTIAPSRVLIIGAGVAGLSAIATARRLGAVVEAYDVRTAVKEEIESLGARFVELPLETGQEGGGSGEYAKEMSEETLRKQQELLAKTVAGSDVVITTAQVQGKKAPVIVTAAMVGGMAPGSVIVDLAADQGGNCELTRAGDTVVSGGVTIVGAGNLASTIPHHASLTYAKNVANFVQLLVKDGALMLDTEDDVVQECLVAKGGAIVNTRVSDALAAEGGTQ
jgi:H+-translocating NAD(P) transhydrogenase subunit alpha